MGGGGSGGGCDVEWIGVDDRNTDELSGRCLPLSTDSGPRCGACASGSFR